ncbi:ABC transporter [Tritrichomonas foetus]|uniref:ABC transporter n=1 Tax=Tritrichomonas foetus TaxID=1144522 RepID=A0A1J4KTZ3_9EUKA|nr:ABC transporter [Tritrichomonas foetus]|eukprot:OHT13236.1 ABC transporter [Tritrichomonas foetus]
MDIYLNEDEAEVNIDNPEESLSYKHPLFYQSMVNYIKFMLKIRWRSTPYRGMYISVILMTFIVSTMFITLKTEENENPFTFFLFDGTSFNLKYYPNIFYCPNTTDVQKAVQEITRIPLNFSYTMFDDYDSMFQMVSQNNTQNLYGFYYQNNFSDITFVTNDMLYYSSIDYYSGFYAVLHHFVPNCKFSFKYREYAKPSQTINIETGSAAFTMIQPFFNIMVAALSSMIKYNVNRHNFLLLINGLPESSFWIGNILCHFIEMLPICGFLGYLVCGLYQDATQIDFTLFEAIFILFAFSYSLRFILFYTFIHEENTLGFYVMFIQILNATEIYTLNYISTMSQTTLFLLMILIPQYPPLVAYYLYAGQKSPEMHWSTPPASNLLSYQKIIFLQIINIIVNSLLTSLMILMNKRKYGQPLIGWKNILKFRFWKNCFKFSPVSLTVNHNQPIIELANIKYTYNNTSYNSSNITNNNVTNHIVNNNNANANGRSNKTVALNGVDLSITTGEVIVLVGSNGSGKSTLIDILIGGLYPDEGIIKICGHNLKDVSREYHSQLGVVFQGNPLFDELTVREHLQLFSFRITENENNNNNNNGNVNENANELNDEISRIADFLHISHILDSQTKNISGGEKRKLGLALAMIQKPRFLIVDEPTAGVDSYSRQQIWRAVGDMPNTTTIASTHSLEESEYISSRLAVVSKGEIAFCGTGAEMRYRFNSGYNLCFLGDGIQLNEICENIKNIIPEAKISLEKKNTIILPSDYRVSDVLEFVEKNKEKFGFNKYTIQIDNLEESLIRLIQAEEGEIHLDL